MIRSLRTSEGRGSSSSRRCRRVIEDGDMVIVYETHDHMKPLRVEAGKVLNNRCRLTPVPSSQCSLVSSMLSPVISPVRILQAVSQLPALHSP